MESKINRITDNPETRWWNKWCDALHRADFLGLFLKFLADLEESKAEDAELDGEKYTYILDEKYRWQNWAVLKVDGKKDIINNLSNIKLVQYLSF